jgi:hypothetical protein
LLQTQLTGQEERKEEERERERWGEGRGGERGERGRGEGGGRGSPLKSAGTKNFFLSMSGMLDLGTFSTITWTGRGRRRTQ